MSWEAIGALGELVGAIAVVVTLVYLNMQIRQSIKVSQAELLRSVNSQFSSLAMEVAKSKELRAIWVRLPQLRSLDDLDADEGVELEMLLRALFNTVHHDVEGSNGGTDEPVSLRWLANTLLVLPVVQQWWKHGPMADGSYGDRFVAAINGEIARSEARPAG